MSPLPLPSENNFLSPYLLLFIGRLLYTARGVTTSVERPS